MLQKLVAIVVDAARRYARVTIAVIVLLALAAAFYAAANFSINTDVTTLLDEKSAWRQNEIAFSKAFPQRDDLLVIVIDGSNGAETDLAADKIADALSDRPDLFKTVRRPEANPYFLHYGLLLLPIDDIASATEQIIRAQPMLASLAADPSPRGLFNLISNMVDGVKAGVVKESDISGLFSRLHNTLQKVLLHPLDPDAWGSLFASEDPSKFEKRRFILAQPVLDYSDLSPGAKSSGYVRHIVELQNIENRYGVTVRLTGPVALADEEFASVAKGMQWALAISIALIGLILYMSLKSWRIILPIFITLFCGLAMTTAFALFMVHSLNLISVAFAVMFTGIAVDFGIQFGVRYRDVRHEKPDFAEALRLTAKRIAVPLTLAALSTAAGFLSFTPTSYRGVAELGLIAGGGMLIAFTLNITLLPALLRFTKPKPEPEPVGFRWAAGLDALIAEQRWQVLVFFAALFFVGIGICFFLRFDFDPLNLKDPHTESVSTMTDLMQDPDTTPYTIDILAANSEAAEQLATRLSARPEVDKALTLSSLVPEEQAKKIALLKDTYNLLNPSLHPPGSMPPPSPDELRQSTQALADKIGFLTGTDAYLFSEDLRRMAKLDDGPLQTASNNMRRSVAKSLAELDERLTPHVIDIRNIPDDLRREWISSDSKARVEVYPKGDPKKRDTLVKFAEAVRSVAPEATGTAVSIQESSKTIRRAFAEAALYSGVTIFLLLLIIMHNLKHTAFVLAPLILAFVLTLGTAAAVDMPLNFANIIALPLLLGLGVSYSIYFVIYWRQGFEKPLQSSMARAVLASAATAFVAFGSLSLSNHPGTASMGLLLALSLFYVLFTTFLFTPALLGKPLNPADSD
ncbi:MAG: MMPL family transporter [Proteobacteria bacterium]|nr:MMPL family transporter [Pseudomonadota bacterium]